MIPPPLPAVILYSGINLLALMAFVLDKIKAKRNGWRIPENTLLLFAALGPFGAFAGMVIFRHKTRHVKFALVPVFLIIHAGILLYFSGLLA